LLCCKDDGKNTHTTQRIRACALACSLPLFLYYFLYVMSCVCVCVVYCCVLFASTPKLQAHITHTTPHTHTAPHSTRKKKATTCRPHSEKRHITRTARALKQNKTDGVMSTTTSARNPPHLIWGEISTPHALCLSAAKPQTPASLHAKAAAERTRASLGAQHADSIVLLAALCMCTYYAPPRAVVIRAVCMARRGIGVLVGVCRNSKCNKHTAPLQVPATHDRQRGKKKSTYSSSTHDVLSLLMITLLFYFCILVRCAGLRLLLTNVCSSNTHPTTAATATKINLFVVAELSSRLPTRAETKYTHNTHTHTHAGRGDERANSTYNTRIYNTARAAEGREVPQATATNVPVC
jgi:hypothetical protein